MSLVLLITFCRIVHVRICLLLLLTCSEGNWVVILPPLNKARSCSRVVIVKMVHFVALGLCRAPSSVNVVVELRKSAILSVETSVELSKLVRHYISLKTYAIPIHRILIKVQAPKLAHPQTTTSIVFSSSSGIQNGSSRSSTTRKMNPAMDQIMNKKAIR